MLTRRIGIPFLAFALAVAACAPAETVDDGAVPSPTGGGDPGRVVPSDALRFSWDLAEPGGRRSVDLPPGPTRVGLVASAPGRGAVGLLAVDRLVEPTLDGVRVVQVLVPGATATVIPDGTVRFVYRDGFDPEWRGRLPRWEEVELDEGPVEIDRLADDDAPAKVATVARGDEMLFLRDDEGRTAFYFSGELRYCFEFGRPLRSLSLSDGEVDTVVEVAPGFSVRVSEDGSDWTTVWTAEVEGTVAPRVELPAALVGASRLCVAFDGGPDVFSRIEELALVAELDGTDLVGLTRHPAGDVTVAYDGGPGRALLFWESPQLALAAEASPTPSEPQVTFDAEALVVALPNGASVTFGIDDRGVPVTLTGILVDGVVVAEAAPDADSPPLAITLLEGDPPPGEPFDWVRYRQEFFRTGRWTPRGRRARRTVDLSAATFEGVEVVGERVVLTWNLDSGERLSWSLAGSDGRLAGAPVAGVEMAWRVTGDGVVESVTVDIPVLVGFGDREIGQYFRRLVEDRAELAGAPRRPEVVWFGESQSFLFVTGPGRTMVASFEEPTWARVAVRRERGRDRYRFVIPVGSGETSALRWWVADRGAADRWAAADLWAAVYDDLRLAYLSAAGVLDGRPLPTLVWNQPSEDEFLADLETFVATGSSPEVGWFERFVDRLDDVADAGIANVIIQAPWISDAEDPEMISSLHAPRSLTVSEMFGGVDGLARLVEEAHARGISVTLWYPSSYSIRSPLFEKRPDWVVWTRDGLPDDGGWGDVLVIEKGDEYRRYVTDRLRTLRTTVPFDGVWMDSWAGIAVATDYSEPRPSPSLDEAIALQRAFTEMGLTQIVIEGLGPLGRPDAYGDYESYSGGPDPNPEQAAEMERLRGREYLLFRIGAGVYLDLDVYERALAAGGLVNVANLDEVEALGADRERLRRLNQDYLEVRDLMDRRRLLVVDGRWVGVAWTSTESSETVIFAFEDFIQELDGTVSVTDVTAETRLEASEVLEVEAHHVYVLSS